MTEDFSEQIESLRQWSKGKIGSEPSWDDKDGFNVLGEFLGDFIRFFTNEDPPELLLRCPVSLQKSIDRIAPKSLRISKKMHWDTKGWNWVDVIIDGRLDQQQLRDLIDSSYQLALDELEPAEELQLESIRLQIELIRQNLSPDETLAKLVEHYGLSHRKEDINKICRQAVLLRTSNDRGKTALAGQTKIGGSPDLPIDFIWPEGSAGKPLAFLAQINLSEIAKAAVLPNIPSSGMLYVFSGYGRDDSGDNTPHSEGEFDDHASTQLRYVPDAGLAIQFREPPPEAGRYPCAIVEPILISTLPSDEAEHDIALLKLTKKEIKKLDMVARSFEKVCAHKLGNPSRHLFLGHANILQAIPTEVIQSKLTLLLQIASDRHAEMEWQDGGYIHIWIKPEDLAAWNLSNIFVDLQSY